MSVAVTCEHLVKKYGDNTIIPDLSVKIREGEFFTLLGPSGCGKTTLLRMMIGFNSIEGGRILFGDRVINQVPVNKRNVGMVFQNYAIFPHMSTFQNVAFGLRNRNIPRPEIESRVDAILHTVHIEELRDRMPNRMSGGQQQRIALARAIVIEPDLLLMDEPLSNLDAKLRIETRDAIKDIQNKTGITTVYVTHDQEEALAISDRIAVMKDGVIQQVGAPQNIYGRPANRFVATFIGRSNLLEAEFDRGTVTFPDGFRVPLDTWGDELPPAGSKVLVSIRPEEFIVRGDGPGIRGTVRSKVFLGPNTHYQVETGFSPPVEVIMTSDQQGEFKTGSPVTLDFVRHKVNIFDPEGRVNFLKGVQNELE
ncbi:Fe(3+) ions import ATP-binding protein FbpC [Treponema primitia ZAS-2]|uniref:Fe(3+) ions import ATP-binding protein FbpC n=1 Tax=Treponema primitia (strain ATCC BAA-887 / DSM 12427 / ZAS-2) TaxID=545694 RepID=F5YMR8_TREPZ|nr:ABC transporter ATP-binding protein [Treponema primitia]AEF84365.1 Fe(3+) ions import ATP-binding protein FbpC [Treponema primitia ZAS-2]